MMKKEPFYKRFVQFFLILLTCSRPPHPSHPSSHYLCASPRVKHGKKEREKGRKSGSGTKLIFYFCMNCIVEKTKTEILFHRRNVAQYLVVVGREKSGCH